MAGSSRLIQAGRWTARQLYCEISRVGWDAALKGSLRRPLAALNRCLLIGLVPVPVRHFRASPVVARRLLRQRTLSTNAGADSPSEGRRRWALKGPYAGPDRFLAGAAFVDRGERQ